MSISFENIPSSSVLLSAAASLTATAILLKSISNDLIPVSLQDYLSSRLQLISNRMSFYLTVVVEEFDGLCPNHMFEAANTYLGEKISPSTQRIKVNKPEKDHELTITVDKNQEILDVFDKNVKLKWVLQSSPVKMSAQISKNGPSRTEVRYFELSFLKKHKATVLKSYLPHVIRKAKEMKEEIKVVRLNTVDYQGGDYWSSVALKHPATFDTIAMDPELKKVLMEDLDRFLSRKDYYKRVGKAWKRGYLFYGPPGTGKSSLVAAMANYLKFDVYDLDLKEVQCNSDLRRLLIGSANRSILVIEDIDCNFGLQNRELDTGVGVVAEDDKITLSGLLNFIDGLWSSCGDERIIIFTTNHKDRLDPALLRPGRMDVQIEMSYCTFVGFKILAYNFLMIKEHDLFRRIEELLSKVDATPAEVAGELMKSDNAEVALLTLESFLQDKEKKA